MWFIPHFPRKRVPGCFPRLVLGDEGPCEITWKAPGTHLNGNEFDRTV